MFPHLFYVLCHALSSNEEHLRDSVLRLLEELCQNLADLAGQLARWADDHGADLVRAKGSRQFLEAKHSY